MNHGRFCTPLPDGRILYTEKRCRICTELSTGVHYGVLACEGCKAFYRRTQQKGKTYECYEGDRCVVGPKAKGRCRACRYRKCVQAGMELDTSRFRSSTLRKREFRRAVSTSSPSKYTNETPVANPRKSSTESNEEAALSRQASTFIMPMDLLSLKFTWGQYYKVSINESFAGISRDAMSWQAYSSSLSDHFALEELMQKTSRLQETISAVNAAIQSVYGADILEWDGTLHNMIINNKVQYQPQASLAVFKENASLAVTESVKKMCDLCAAMPGFSTLSPADQELLLRERWSEGWLVTFHRQIQNGQTYCLLGPLRIQCSLYWLQHIMSQDAIRAVFIQSTALNKVKLSYLEAYLLYAVSMFAPEATSAQDKPKLAILQSHYRDCLLYVLRSNSSRHKDNKGQEDRLQRERDVLKLAETLRYYNLVGRKYVAGLEFLGDLEDEPP